MSKTRFTLGQLAELLAVDCMGNPDTTITGLATLASAGKGQLSFLANNRYQSALKTTQASAVIVRADKMHECPCDCLVASDPYLTYAKASQLFDQQRMQRREGGIHPNACVSESAVIGAETTIAANVVIGENVSIGRNTLIGPGCSIGDNTVIGDNCILYANISVYHDVTIGNAVMVHSATVIGSDGFGFAPSADGWVKIAQLGRVRIGDNVEIGAGTTIDRGALDDTVIGDNVIIDNQVVIAHNVTIGEHTAIAGAVGIAGSTRIGKRCTIAGGVGIVGHLTIVDDVHITVCTVVSQSINKAGSYSSGTSMQNTVQWRKNAVRFSTLDQMHRRIGALEKSDKPA